jgi:hypothetical protein
MGRGGHLVSITDPITATNGDHPPRATDNAAETITEGITGGITASRRDPPRTGPFLRNGPREGLAIRVRVNLETYELVSRVSRDYGLTMEGVAQVLLARAAADQRQLDDRVSARAERRYVTTSPNYLRSNRGQPEDGRETTGPVRFSGDDGAATTPAQGGNGPDRPSFDRFSRGA